MALALLLVDVQEDFLASEGLTPDRTTLIDALGRLLRVAREFGWAIVHVRTRVAADGADAMPHWRRSGRLLCVAGSAGAEPPPTLRPGPGEIVFDKRFFSAFGAPGLVETLAVLGVDRLVVAGVHTHACVRATATDAYATGFEVFVPTDAIASYDPDHAALSLRWMDGRVARCAPLDEIVAHLEATQ